MIEKLVVLKSPRQRGIEGWLMLLLSPSIAFGARLLAHGPSALGAVLVFLIYFLLPAAGSALATRFGRGEWMTADERRKRMLDRLLTKPAWRTILGMSLGMMVWMGSVFATFADVSDRRATAFLVAWTLIFGGLYGAYCHRMLRRQRVLIDDAEREHWPEQTLWDWLPGYLRLSYACLVVGLAVGLGVGLLLPPPWNIAFYGCTLIAGKLVAARLQERREIARRPLLWTKLGFGAALLVGVLQLGLPLGVYGAWAPVVLGHRFGLASVVMGLGATLLGTLCILVIWISARLAEMGRRDRPA